jgi:PAS domain S-box-containing protein
LKDKEINEPRKQELQERLATIIQLYDYDNIFVLNKKGEVLLTVKDTYLGALTSSTLHLFQEALAEKRPIFSTFYQCQVHHRTHLDLCVPVVIRRGHHEEVVGGFIFLIDPEKFLYPLIQSWPTPSDTAETLLVEGQGDAVVFLNKLRHSEAPPLTLRYPLTEELLPAARAVAKWSGALEGRDYRRVPVLAVVRAIPDSPWHLVAKIDLAEIDQPLHREARVIAIGVLCLILLVGSVLGWILNDQKKRHFEALFRLEQERQAIRNHFDYLVKFANDIILLLDQEGNLKEVNDRAAAAYGYSREELLQLNIRDLLPADELPMLIRCSREQLAGKGKIYERRHRRRDGSFFPVEVSVNLVQVDGKEYFQEIIRDISERRQAEAALRESEERFRLAFENANVGLTMVGLDGRHLQVNEALCRMLGYSREELLGMSVQDTAHPDDLDKSPGFIRKALAGEITSSIFEKRHLHKTGRVVWILVSSTLVRDAHSKPLYFISLVQDITAQRQAESDLALHAVRLQALLDLHLKAQDPQQEIVDFVLEAALRITQSKYCWLGQVDEAESVMTINKWSKETMAQSAVNAEPIHCPAVDAGLWEDIIRRRRVVLVNDYQATHEGKKGLPAGHVPIQRLLAVPVLEGGRVVAGAAVANKPEDYTDDDVKALTSLLQQTWGILTRRQAEENFRTLVNSAPMGIFLVQDRKFRMVNPGFSKISGYAAEELIGRDSLSLVAPGYRAEVRSNAIRMLKGQSVAPHEFPIITKSDDTKWVVETVSSTDYQGRRAVLGYFLDITDHKNLEGQFFQAQKMEAVGRLAGGVAHDFNNMLNIILGYSEVMKMQLAKHDPLAVNVEEIIKAAQRSAALTQQLLAFSRKQIIEPQVLNLNRKIADMENMLRRLLGEDIDLALVLDPSLAAVKADPSQIDQIILNLAVNARDAMPRGGKLTLETANVTLDEAYTRTHAYVIPGSYVMLAITDTGHGMDAATQAKVFEPFFTTKEDGQGTGLGLATVYGILKQNNGYIQVYSEIDRGTTFKIYLPQVREEVPAAQPPKAREAATLFGSETVLLVEDDDALRELTRTILRRYGYQVLEARHGGEALLLCEKHPEPIHLVLTDVVMPQMNGRELVDRLKLLRPHLKVIYMSGYTTNAVVHHGVIEAKTPFLQKPFAINTALEKIRQVLDEAGD